MTGEVRPKGGSGLASTSSFHSEVREDFLVSVSTVADGGEGRGCWTWQSSSPCPESWICNLSSWVLLPEDGSDPAASTEEGPVGSKGITHCQPQSRQINTHCW